MRRTNSAIAIALGLTLGFAACERTEDGAAGDDIDISIPDDADEKIEEAGRDVGEAVGEGLEKAGGAIEEAGQDVQEEMQEGRAEDDTVGM